MASPMEHPAPETTVYEAIDALVDYAGRHLDLDPRNADWIRNRIFALFGLSSYRPTGATAGEDAQDAPAPDALLARLRDALESAGLSDHDDWPAVEDEVMGILTADPARIADAFAEVEGAYDGMAAMRWLYDHCVSNTYVKKSQLDRNPRFESHGIVVTINRVKPEFRNMRKAAVGNAVAGGYPQCTICHENEGFAGRNKRTLRTVPVTLGGEDWFWQFSPYGYFSQHGICVNREHTPMHVDRDTFVHLLDFVDRFPGYFLGCNAALPRIGGSVLAHDHYQGGGEILPMLKAPAWATLHLDAHPDAVVEILNWPGTAVRVVSPSRGTIVEVSDLIRRAWIDYNNPDLDIVSHDANGNRQSALSPSAIRTDRGYEMNLIFRNNAVSDAFPEGVFHAHPEFWPIKQEPIGLIEAQGLFILPGRLVDQLGRVEDSIAEDRPLPDDMAEFRMIRDEIAAILSANAAAGPDGAYGREAIRAAVRDELGSVCERILGNTAVFKNKALTLGFLESLGFMQHAGGVAGSIAADDSGTERS